MLNKRSAQWNSTLLNQHGNFDHISYRIMRDGDLHLPLTTHIEVHLRKEVSSRVRCLHRTWGREHTMLTHHRQEGHACTIHRSAIEIMHRYRDWAFADADLLK